MELFLCATLSRYLLPRSAIRKIQLPTPTHSHNIRPSPPIVSPLGFLKGNYIASSWEIIFGNFWILYLDIVLYQNLTPSSNPRTQYMGFPSYSFTSRFLIVKLYCKLYLEIVLQNVLSNVKLYMIYLLEITLNVIWGHHLLPKSDSLLQPTTHVIYGLFLR